MDIDLIRKVKKFIKEQFDSFEIELYDDVTNKFIELRDEDEDELRELIYDIKHHKED